MTFLVPDEFVVELSIGDEDMKSQWFLVDFRWAFQPTSDLSDWLRADVERLGNEALEKGLRELYESLRMFIIEVNH